MPAKVSCLVELKNLDSSDFFNSDSPAINITPASAAIAELEITVRAVMLLLRILSLESFQKTVELLPLMEISLFSKAE